MNVDTALIQAYRLYTSALEARLLHDDETGDETRYRNRKERQVFGHLVDCLQSLRDGTISLAQVRGILNRGEESDNALERADYRLLRGMIYNAAREVLNQIA